jgi:hypothetical protein
VTISPAYAAGFLDAEGCVGVYPANRRTTWHSVVSFGQTQPHGLLALHAVYGGSLRVTAGQTPRERPKLHLQICATAAVLHFLHEVFPYLGEKREQARLVLEQFHLGLSREAGFELYDNLIGLKARELSADEIAYYGKQKVRICTASGCDRRSRARTLCTAHYQARPLRARSGERCGAAFQYGAEPTEDDIHYAAGYFDGDGSVDFRKYGPTWVPAIAFNQTQSEGLVRLHRIYGGSLRLRPGYGTRRPQLRWFLGRRCAALRFLSDIEPHLLEKRDQVLDILNICSTAVNDSGAVALCQRLARMRESSLFDHLALLPMKLCEKVLRLRDTHDLVGSAVAEI